LILPFVSFLRPRLLMSVINPPTEVGREMSGVFVDLSNASVGPQSLFGTLALHRFTHPNKQTIG
jgi:hypothetical protein